MYTDKVVFNSRIDIVKNKKVPLFNRYNMQMIKHGSNDKRRLELMIVN